MDRAELERLLGQVNAEKADAQNQVAALQGRLTTLTRAADGLQALLDMTPAPREWASGPGPNAGQAAKSESVGEAAHVVAAADSSGEEVPKGLKAARLILESDTSRFWNVREVSDEQIRRGWAEPRPRGTKGNPPARVALERLQAKYPDNVQVIPTPVLAYKWVPGAPQGSTTPENDFFPLADATGKSTAGENGHTTRSPVRARHAGGDSDGS